MKLASVYFDDHVVIPGGKDLGGGLARSDLREASFHAADGWDIEWDGALFTLWCEGMPRPVKVGGYGFTFVEAEFAGTAVVTSIDGPGTNTVTLDDPNEVRTFTPATKRRRK